MSKPLPNMLSTQPKYEVRRTLPFKLKDGGKKSAMEFNFMRDFGFIPESIIIEKVRGKNNVLALNVVLTEAEVKKEKKALLRERAKKVKKLKGSSGGAKKGR